MAISLPSKRWFSRSTPRLPSTAAALLLLGSMPGRATQIIWDALIGRPHVTSGGQPLPGTFVFLLGVFDLEFIPAAVNRAEWAQRWHTASAARWDPATRYYSGEVNFTTNPVPFTAGNPAWVWGISGTEWILFRRSTWNWPTGSPIGGPPLFWTANSSVSPIAGQVSAPGSAEFYYRTESTGPDLPPVLPWAVWQNLHFTSAQLANPLISGPTADPDGDGFVNASEYAGMSWPLSATSLPPLNSETGLVSSAAGLHLALRFSFDPRADLVFTPEASSDLLKWDATPGVILIMQDSIPGSMFYRQAETVESAARFHLRLRFAPIP